MNKTLDIRFTGEPGLGRRLSNLFPYKFTFDGITYASMEAFFGCLRTASWIEKQKLYSASGMDSWNMGHKHMTWYSSQTVNYNGITINRSSVEYDDLITSAFDALFANEDFKQALMETGDCKLIHTIGKTAKNKTLLTRKEFIGHLNRLRNKLYERKFYNIFEFLETQEGNTEE